MIPLNLKKIYSPAEEEDLTRPVKPTLKVKRLDFRLIEEREKKKAAKALKLVTGTILFLLNFLE
jgi:hypothetical protein